MSSVCLFSLSPLVSISVCPRALFSGHRRCGCPSFLLGPHPQGLLGSCRGPGSLAPRTDVCVPKRRATSSPWLSPMLWGGAGGGVQVGVAGGAAHSGLHPARALSRAGTAGALRAVRLGKPWRARG